jgi:hypothetical protein
MSKAGSIAAFQRSSGRLLNYLYVGYRSVKETKNMKKSGLKGIQSDLALLGSLFQFLRMLSSFFQFLFIMTTKQDGNKEAIKNPRPEYSDRVTNEIKRRHQVIFSTADMLDIKLGVILGFIVLVIVQIILSGEIITVLRQNIAFFESNPVAGSFGLQDLINLLSLAMFLGGLACIIFAAYVGERAFATAYYYDLKIDEYVDMYRAGELEANNFDKLVALTLLDADRENKEKIDKKAVEFGRTLKFFSWGIVLLVAHFAIVVIF